MLGTLLQIANNNLIHIDIIEVAVLSLFILLLSVMLIRAEKNSIVPAFPKNEADEKTDKAGKEVVKISVLLVFLVFSAQWIMQSPFITQTVW